MIKVIYSISYTCIDIPVCLYALAKSRNGLNRAKKWFVGSRSHRKTGFHVISRQRCKFVDLDLSADFMQTYDQKIRLSHLSG